MSLYLDITNNMLCTPTHYILLPFFIIACTLYTSQYKSKSKLLLVTITKLDKKAALIYRRN